MKKLILVVLIAFSMVNVVTAHAINIMPTDSYSFTTWDKEPPYVTDKFPLPGATNVDSNTVISCRVKDDGAGVDINTIVMKVNGAVIVPTITGDKHDYYLEHDPIQLPDGQTVNVSVDANDLAN